MIGSVSPEALGRAPSLRAHRYRSAVEASAQTVPVIGSGGGFSWTAAVLRFEEVTR